MSKRKFSKMLTRGRKQRAQSQGKQKIFPAAFTLIELLVVIAIIALLLSIIMPALKAVKKQAQGTICATNQKQWALCYMLYSQDNDDMFPPFVGGTLATTYMESLRYYYDDLNKIRTCPSATKVSTENPTTLQPLSFFGDTLFAWQVDSQAAGWVADDDWGIGSYTENSWIRNIPNDDECWKKITLIRNTSNVPMIGDGKWNNAWPDHTDPPPSSGSPPSYSLGNWAQIYCYVMKRHKDGINVALADMTVKYIEVEDLWKLKWHREYQTRNDIDLSNLK